MVFKAHIDPVASILDERREPRRAMQLETSGVLPGGFEANVTVHNLSATGLLIETELPLEQGEVLSVELPELGAVEAEIVWSSERLYGCAFARELDDGSLAAAQLQSRFDGLPDTPADPPISAPVLGRALESFGSRLNRMRRERSMTLAQIADALEVSKPTVWAWEKGKAKPLPERIEAIAGALGVSASELVGEDGGADGARSVVEDCRLRIATAYGTPAESIRIMVVL